MNWNIKPADFLDDLGWKYKKKGQWLSLNVCPFCKGGSSHDTQTFIVHSSDGNYSCSRSKCGKRGSFWGLIESQGKNPRDYAEKHSKKRFIYR